jgi:predicted  nucleic acid-binding Zn-ribbon protein
MNVSAESITTYKTQWNDRIIALEQETTALNERIQAISVETQQLRGAIQACEVLLTLATPATFTEPDSDSQFLPKDE